MLITIGEGSSANAFELSRSTLFFDLPKRGIGLHWNWSAGDFVYNAPAGFPQLARRVLDRFRTDEVSAERAGKLRASRACGARAERKAAKGQRHRRRP